jgi:hypothetical protein
MAYTYSKIASYTVGSGGISEVSFLAIPQNYNHLIIRTSSRTTRTANTINVLSVTFNGVTTNQSARFLYGDGNGLAVGVDTIIWGLIAATDAATANTFGNSEMLITNYASSNFKPTLSDGLSENNASGASSAYTVASAGLWSSTDPIYSISFASSTSNTIKQHSTFTLYGVKAEV